MTSAHLWAVWLLFPTLALVRLVEALVDTRRAHVVADVLTGITLCAYWMSHP